MKIKELIKILEQFNPDGEIVSFYDCQPSKLMADDISIYNGKIPFDGEYPLLYGDGDDCWMKKTSQGYDTNNTSGLIIENK